ncbi:hypothetical protein [Nitrosopumilus maritimus]|uniref:Uncharacterized protein n=1 Tax=Nitrosopumilus maritimus (strain SCM1) TaxID=436308 RepID=A9A290_NITMS|nr:hypothetical protein [Nitrosopumilus maritimus]ABX12801.1 hypothetical protein Nmar_0905 [Nitrosopumilus maritimus SCM1]
MKIGYSALFLIAIVLSMAITIQIGSIESVDAAKAQGVKSSKYGMETKHKVCGDRLCTPEDFTSDGERKSLPELRGSSISSQMAMAKMERLFELHRTQLVSAWDSLNDSEKSHMMKMFDKMYEKMQSMSFVDHMQHMSHMMNDKQHDMKDKHGMSGSCKDSSHGKDGAHGEHSCSCKCGKHSEHDRDDKHGMGGSCKDSSHGSSCGGKEHNCSCHK